MDNEEVTIVQTFSYRFPLREDFVVAFELPLDLTSLEAEKIAIWLRNMSIPGN